MTLLRQYTVRKTKGSKRPRSVEGRSGGSERGNENSLTDLPTAQGLFGFKALTILALYIMMDCWISLSYVTLSTSSACDFGFPPSALSVWSGLAQHRYILANCYFRALVTKMSARFITQRWAACRDLSGYVFFLIRSQFIPSVCISTYFPFSFSPSKVKRIGLVFSRRVHIHLGPSYLQSRLHPFPNENHNGDG